MLTEKGYEVRILTRHPKADRHFWWDPVAGQIDVRALENVDAVINLAGEGIADKRWTPARKQALIDSRVRSAAVLREAIDRMPTKPKVYVSASAIGFYGDSGEKEVVETDLPADASFMVQCCGEWEKAANSLRETGVRTVIFRIGIVLATEGGALAEILRPMRLGIAGYFADGRAWWSWIHRTDLCRLFIWAVEHEQAAGTFNAVAPNPVRNRHLLRALVAARRQPALQLPAPAFALQVMLGERAAVVLNSNRVSGAKVVQAGFEFDFSHIEEAFGDLCRKATR